MDDEVGQLRRLKWSKVDDILVAVSGHRTVTINKSDPSTVRVQSGKNYSYTVKDVYSEIESVYNSTKEQL